MVPPPEVRPSGLEDQRRRRLRLPQCRRRRGTAGCIFCNVRSFSPSRRGPPRRSPPRSTTPRRHLRRRNAAEHFIAYFQPGTNTYAPVDRLRAAFEEALAQPQVVGLAIGTRPDCVPDDVLDLLAELAQRTWLVVELGLQSVHDRSLAWIGRGHDYAAFVDAAERCRRRGLAIGAHVILGLPGESRDDMLATAQEIGRLGIHSVKLHNLYAVRDTPLADAVAAGTIRLPEFDEYIGYVADFLEAIPPGCVVDRLCGDAPPQYLIAPHGPRTNRPSALRSRASWPAAEVTAGGPLHRAFSRRTRAAIAPLSISLARRLLLLSRDRSGSDGRWPGVLGPPYRPAKAPGERKVRAP